MRKHGRLDAWLGSRLTRCCLSNVNLNSKIALRTGNDPAARSLNPYLRSIFENKNARCELPAAIRTVPSSWSATKSPPGSAAKFDDNRKCLVTDEISPDDFPDGYRAGKYIRGGLQVVAGVVPFAGGLGLQLEVPGRKASRKR